MTPKQIKTHRLKAGLTQEQLARVLGVSPLTLSRWERGGKPNKAGAQALQRLFEPDHFEAWTQHQADLLNMQINPPEHPSEEVSHGLLSRGLLRLQEAGAQCGTTVVAIGSAAMGAHGYPRATKDFDVVGPRPEDAACFVSFAAQRGFIGSAGPQTVPSTPPGAPELRFLPLSWPEVLVDRKPMGVEAFLVENPFLESLVDRALSTTKGIRVASLEDLLLLKLLSWRAKDQLDVLWILSSKPKLNLRYLKSWIKKMNLAENWEEAEIRLAAGDKGW